ncbi:transport and Golgi organization 2 homolog [Herrania umbratica]|uniref:Transport and Golgi organization 2 homolog n=1 Tax=Herrania umbratica TaxID=108875 RepID=A0A6J1AFM5_9ROSI|nr:transport and Golgi organization 2 homolog [Herrania umbratica]
MCIAAFVWQAHPLYPLLLLQNRDEYHNRPTTPVAWWDDGSGILGGRDEVAGGTWLACSRQGRVAFLTNVLELHTLPEAKSRGDLPVLFLESAKSPKEFAEELVKEAHQYNGFNLILADIPAKSMVYASNRPKGEAVSIQQVSPGLHVLSNAKLDSPWHKTQRLGKNFKQMLNKHGKNEVTMKEMVEKLMKDKVKADKSKLPGICALDWEFNLSSIFVEVDTPLGLYGTRSTAALTIHASGEVAFYEKYLEKDVWKERTINYHIQKVKQIEVVNHPF